MYYTKSFRRGGKVRRLYIGRGPMAELVALQDEAERAARAAVRAAFAEERVAVGAARENSKLVDSVAHELLTAAMTAAGFRRVNRMWRRCAKMERSPRPKGPRERAQANLLSDRGEAAPSTTELRQFLSGVVPSPPQPTDLVRRAEDGWVALIAGASDAYRSAIVRQLAEFKDGLGRCESRLDRVLVDQAGICWLEGMYFAIRVTEAAKVETAVAHLKFLHEAVDRSHRRMGVLVRQFAAVRGLLLASGTPSEPTGTRATARRAPRRAAAAPRRAGG